ncbi:MAG: cell division protein FtsQ/DivIB [Rhodospirillaceae bacterium]|nr:cell division protein FtsQ/DivIB [Rhodospirillaceae bacterium]
MKLNVKFWKKDVAKDATRPSVKPRKRVAPIWRTRRIVAVFAIVAFSGIAGATTWVAQSGWAEKKLDDIRWQAIATSTKFGFTVQEVFVTGRGETKRQEIMRMLEVERGAPILAYDFIKAKDRVESLPWVLNAKIERLLPDTIVLHLIERRPLALWQNDGKFFLIDEEGEVITSRGLDRFKGMMHVVGPDAPDNVGPLLELLQTQPEIKNKVKSAVRIGGRRWDLRLNGGVDVRLPEDGAPEALARLARFERESNLLSRDIKILDLRVPDRVILRRQPDAQAKPDTQRENKI